MDVDDTPIVHAEVRNWSTGFSHRIVAYGCAGPWVGYDDTSYVETPYGAFISFRYDTDTSAIRVASVPTESATTDLPEPPRVLIVDDDVNVLRSVKRRFERDPRYGHVSAYSSPQEALTAHASGLLGAVHVLVTDLQMPGMDGITLAEQFVGGEHNPLRAVFIHSGHLNWQNSPSYADRLRVFLQSRVPELVCAEKPCDPCAEVAALLGL